MYITLFDTSGMVFSSTHLNSTLRRGDIIVFEGDWRAKIQEVSVLDGQQYMAFWDDEAKPLSQRNARPTPLTNLFPFEGYRLRVKEFLYGV